ncbi:uncharacterized protein LOC120339558 [Styela clava]
MKVIVAGFPKTGTKTINTVLTEFGYKVYDYPENAFDYGDDWGRIFKEGWSVSDFQRMYRDVDAVVDVPCSYFWEEIHKAFPDAKIILSIRENEEAWLKSLENQMKMIDFNMLGLMQHLSPTFRKLERNMDLNFSPAMFGISDIRDIGRKPYNKELLKLKYRAHNAHVIQNAPSDKLLIYKVTDGWDPICKFLGVPVPNKPFPHKNKGGKYVIDIINSHPYARKMEKELLLSLLASATMIGIGGYMVYKIGFSNLRETSMNLFTSAQSYFCE